MKLLDPIDVSGMPSVDLEEVIAVTTQKRENDEMQNVHVPLLMETPKLLPGRVVVGVTPIMARLVVYNS